MLRILILIAGGLVALVLLIVAVGLRAAGRPRGDARGAADGAPDRVFAALREVEKFPRGDPA